MAIILTFLRRHWLKIALAVLLVGSGVWFRGVLADRAALKTEVSRLEAHTAFLESHIARTEAAIAEAEEAAVAAQIRAREASRRLRDSNTEEDRAWKSDRIPDSILDSLR